ncbi:MAG: hypothetical protein ACI4T8_04450 [Christensenellales bacterium]
MKECLIFCISILLVILLIDVLCPVKKMNKITKFLVNSIIILVCFIFVVKKVNSMSIISEFNYNFEEEESILQLSELENEYLENLIKDQLLSSGINCYKVQINSSFNKTSNKTEYENVVVFIDGSNYTQEEVTKTVQNIIYSEVVVYGR